MFPGDTWIWFPCHPGRGKRSAGMSRGVKMRLSQTAEGTKSALRYQVIELSVNSMTLISQLSCAISSRCTRRNSAIVIDYITPILNCGNFRSILSPLFNINSLHGKQFFLRCNAAKKYSALYRNKRFATTRL
jgi:hypothetical protein